MDERGEGIDHEDAMGLTELVEAAGVSVRTVRYYISEGLPPPVGAGPRAAYTSEHLDRLRLIVRLKDTYLPLREIRRRLRGLDAGAVRALLEEDSSDSGPRLDEAPRRHADRQERTPLQSTRHAEDSAAAYLSRLLPPRHGTQPAPADAAPPARFSWLAPGAPHPQQPAFVGEPSEAPEQDVEGSESVPAERGDANDPASLIRADLDRGAALAALEAIADSEEIPAESWRRLRLGDDAELLIRADAYERQREQIESLVAWARRILD